MVRPQGSKFLLDIGAIFSQMGRDLNQLGADFPSHEYGHGQAKGHHDQDGRDAPDTQFLKPADQRREQET